MTVAPLVFEDFTVTSLFCEYRAYTVRIKMKLSPDRNWALRVLTNLGFATRKDIKRWCSFASIPFGLLSLDMSGTARLTAPLLFKGEKNAILILMVLLPLNFVRFFNWKAGAKVISWAKSYPQKPLFIHYAQPLIYWWQTATAEVTQPKWKNFMVCVFFWNSKWSTDIHGMTPYQTQQTKVRAALGLGGSCATDIWNILL